MEAQRASNRALADMVGVSGKTIDRDVAATNDAKDQPEPATGKASSNGAATNVALTGADAAKLAQRSGRNIAEGRQRLCTNRPFTVESRDAEHRISKIDREARRESAQALRRPDVGRLAAAERLADHLARLRERIPGTARDSPRDR